MAWSSAVQETKSSHKVKPPHTLALKIGTRCDSVPPSLGWQKQHQAKTLQKWAKKSVRMWSSCWNITLLVGGSTKWYYHFGELVVNFLIMLNIHWPHDPEIPLLGIYPRVMQSCVCKKTLTAMLTAALFIVAPTWKNPNVHHCGNGEINCSIHSHSGVLFNHTRQAIATYKVMDAA